MKVTLLLPVYNGSKFIDKALECVNSQTYKNTEVYLCDHGSTDSTWDSMVSFECKFECFKNKYYRDEKDTKYNAVNVVNDVVSKMRGDILYVYSVDDIMDKNFLLNNVMEYYEKPEMKIWNSLMRFGVLDSDHVLKNANFVKNNSPVGFVYNNIEELKKQMINRSVVFCPTVIFTKEVLKEVGLFDSEKMNCSDYDFFLRAIDKGYYIHLIQKDLGMRYNIHSGQCTEILKKKKDGYDERTLQEKYKEKWGI